jgi:hypothetical protein
VFGLAIIAVDREPAAWALFFGGIGAGASLTMGAWRCVEAAWPQYFRFPGPLSHQIQIDLQLGLAHLLEQSGLPSAFFVESNVNEPVDVRRVFDSCFIQDAYSLPPNEAHEKAEFKYYVLARAGLEIARGRRCRANVVARENHDGEYGTCAVSL